MDGLDIPNDYPDIGFFEIDKVVFPEQYST